jgi:acetyl-CoA carboxylase biotin carboxyl carrier protein
MPDQPSQGERTPEQRRADHASLARLSDTLVPALVAKVTGTGLGELEVREGDWRIRVRRPVPGGQAASARRSERPRLGATSHPHPAEAKAARAAAPSEGAQAADRARGVALSPAVGMFRPGLPVGSTVHAGDRIAIVDLLGIPQDVVAPIDGTVVEILAQGGEAVEYGEEIAIVEATPEPERDPLDGADGDGEA